MLSLAVRVIQEPALPFTSPEQIREKLWFVVTPADGDHNVPSAPACLQMASAYEDPPTPAAKARLIDGGFSESTDKSGYRLLRVALPLSELEEPSTLDIQIEVGVAWAKGLLRAASFLHTGSVG